jgi:hypothetical protein
LSLISQKKNVWIFYAHVSEWTRKKLILAHCHPNTKHQLENYEEKIATMYMQTTYFRQFERGKYFWLAAKRKFHSRTQIFFLLILLSTNDTTKTRENRKWKNMLESHDNLDVPSFPNILAHFREFPCERKRERRKKKKISEKNFRP